MAPIIVEPLPMSEETLATGCLKSKAAKEASLVVPESASGNCKVCKEPEPEGMDSCVAKREPEPESPEVSPREPESEPSSPTARPRRETLTIFDWDDTLLCSSFLSAHSKDGELPSATKQHLRNIEASTRQLLEFAIRRGKCIIVTNAVEGWVEYSAAKYLPGLCDVLAKVQVISARSTYGQTMPDQADEWKVQAFRALRQQLGDQVHLNLTVIGDSEMEMLAGKVLSQEFDHVVLKTIKLKEAPSPEDLFKEHQVISQKFEKILIAPRELSISLSRKWAGSAA
jgi:hypothetical protein